MKFQDLMIGDLLYVPGANQYHVNKDGSVTNEDDKNSWVHLVVDIRIRPKTGTYEALDIDVLNSRGMLVTIGRPRLSDIKTHLHVIRGGVHINAMPPRP